MNMPQLQEHVRSMLQQTDISPEEFLALRSPLRHAIALMIAAYCRQDLCEARRLFLYCEAQLAEYGRPKSEDEMEPLNILRDICRVCEEIFENQRKYRQAMMLSVS